ncbi:hypothetical protein P4199_28050, partial [Bacillus thuringiensis]|nr:hypothetical protein [Bacillus thuringiensis]
DLTNLLYVKLYIPKLVQTVYIKVFLIISKKTNGNVFPVIRYQSVTAINTNQNKKIKEHSALIKCLTTWLTVRLTTLGKHLL